MSIAEALRPIPMGNAMSTEASGADPLSAARLALVQLSEQIGDMAVTSISLHTVLIDAEELLPWEATAYASLAE